MLINRLKRLKRKIMEFLENRINKVGKELGDEAKALTKCYYLDGYLSLLRAVDKLIKQSQTNKAKTAPTVSNFKWVLDAIQLDAEESRSMARSGIKIGLVDIWDEHNRRAARKEGEKDALKFLISSKEFKND